MKQCNACAKNLTCDRKECKFKSYIQEKNYGEVKRDGSSKNIYKRKHKIFFGGNM